ncbi:MAG: acetylxylan esterase [Bryobacterales bacterium]|nr:acetylxylan esterase [Bryobacterales bacterium]
MKLSTAALVGATFISFSLQSQDAADAALRRWKDAAAAQQRRADDPFLHWMDQIAQRQLKQRDNEIAQVRTTGDAENRKQAVREKLLKLLGGLPDYKGPLNPKITGRLENESFTIEKVIYESLPGFFVTANLYRPNQAGRYPGILLQSGHVQEGKPEGQRLAANLAAKGFVVLAFDPIGQGERLQAYDPQLDGSAAGWGTMEHMQAGAQSLLLGDGVARYFIWDAMRSLDYLTSRPEVDPTKIGAVGCSGGGALTTYIGALDPRVTAVASACSTNSFKLMFARKVPNGEFHAEMGIPGFLAAGLDTADFVELAAPKPWIILATEGDFFTPDAAQVVYEEAWNWYRIYGAEDKVQYFVGPGPHGTPLETREIIYKWMIRWLKDGQGDFHEQPVRMYTNLELLATSTGQVQDLPGSRRIHQLILEEFHSRRRKGTVPQMLSELRRLEIPTDTAAPEMKVLEETAGEILRQRVQFQSEPGVNIEGTLHIPRTSAKKPAVLIVADRAMTPFAQKIAKSGCVALELEPRDSPWGYDYRPLIGNWMAVTRADHIGRNLPAMRAHDILRGIDLLAARNDVDAASIRAAARGIKGIWLLLAAATDPRIRKIWLDRTPYSFSSSLERSVTTGLLDATIPGFVLHWDLEDLVKAMGERPVMWTDPTNWMGRIVAAGPAYRYRYVLGDTTDLMEVQDDAYIAELIK